MTLYTARSLASGSNKRMRAFWLFMVAAAFVFVAGPLEAQNEVSEQQSSSENSPISTDDRGNGVLGDDFARDTGAIIVTAQRLGESNLFEPVIQPEDSCQANAPDLGEGEPGFAIDASGLTKIRQLERIRRKTRAGTIFVSGGSFVGADFSKAKLYNMCFFGTDLSQTNWTGLEAEGLGFVNVDLTGAKMARSQLTNVLFRDVKLGLVDARQARWTQGRLDGGWEGSLRELNLTGADLTDFRFVCGTSPMDGCPLERAGITMKDANLRRASLHSFYAADLDLAGARVDQTELSLDYVRLLEGSKLVGPVVLRSLRRAVMLFPGEVKQLTKVAEIAEQELEVCPVVEPESGTPRTALAIACDIPGSATKNLLRSVALLERQARTAEGSDPADYDRRFRTWVEGRDSCLAFTNPEEQTTCVTTAYRTRQKNLRMALGKPPWLSDRGYRLFLSREAAFPTDKDAPGLYGRVLPVLLDQAVAAVIVRSDGEGGIQAKGVALEGCFFEQADLSYDIEQAQIGFAAETPRSRSRRRRRSPPPSPSVEDPLIEITGRSARIEGQGLARAAGECGVGNPFPRMEEIELDDRLLATIWERF
ncbi:MAG: pentapeptide repeat-containing protein [Erythrobacter sp.]